MKSLSIESASLAASEAVEFLFAGLVPSTVNTGFNDQDAERGGPERTALRMLVKSQFRTRYRSFPHSEFGGCRRGSGWGKESENTSQGNTKCHPFSGFSSPRKLPTQKLSQRSENRSPQRKKDMNQLRSSIKWF